MDHEPEPEVVRHQMEQTRASLTEKLETLEHQVVGTVRGATTAVSDAVENVKEVVQETVDTVKGSVQETVETVKSTFDLRRQVEQHPWAMMGGSVALGCLGGFLLGRARQGRTRTTGPRQAPGRETPWSSARGDGRAQSYLPAAEAAGGEAARLSSEQARPGLLGSLNEMFGPEIATLKGLAIGAALSLVRDMITRPAPEQVKPRLAEIMDNLTVKLGGQPVQGPLLPEATREDHPPSARACAHHAPSDPGRPIRAL
jgi:ElaB/YqjD/DUF883 family membrane-anchored ribosome-binding protein